MVRMPLYHDPCGGQKSRSAADSSLKQLVDSRGEDPQVPDTRRCVMATSCLHSECLLVDPESAGQSLDEAGRG